MQFVKGMGRGGWIFSDSGCLFPRRGALSDEMGASNRGFEAPVRTRAVSLVGDEHVVWEFAANIGVATNDARQCLLIDEAD